MAGYIGARSGTLAPTTVGKVQDLTATDTTPEVTIINNTHEDTDGGREGKVIFKGQQSGGEESTLAEIQGSHDGSSDDEKGDLIFKTNDGSDGSSPTERLRIDSNGAISTTTAGTNNTRFGLDAGKSIASGGNYNTLVGDFAGDALTTGDNNVAVGFEALKTEDANGNSTAIGYRALKTQNAGAESYNVGVGVDSGLSITTATHNTLIGSLVGDALTSGGANVAIGGGASYAALGSDTQGKFTTAIGFGALTAQNFTSDTASNNTAVGYFAGGVMTTGTANTFIGANAGDDCVDGVSNVAVGYNALSADSGNLCTAVGVDALRDSTGAQNTGVGADALRGNTTGINNTAMGYAAIGQTTHTGSYNTTYGYAAGYELTSGSNNTLIGSNAGRSSAPGGTHTTGSNSVVIGDNGVTAAYIKVSWTVTSDERDKTDFTPLDLGLDFVNGMQPYTFKWDQRSDYGDNTADDYKVTDQTPDGTHKKDQLDVGFKAQDIETLEKEAGYKIDDETNLISSLSQDKTQYGLRYEKFIPILTKAIQELSAKVDALETENTAIKSRLDALEAE